MTRLFGHYYKLTFGPAGGVGRVIEGDISGGLDISFEVTKSLKKSANKAKITLFNLADASIGALEEKGAVIQLIAGYRSPGADNAALIFSGQVAKRGVETVWDGPTRTTTIEAGDAELDMAKARADVSLAPGATSKEALEKLIAAMGVGVGNVADLPVKTFAGGYVHAGWAREAITEICRDLGRSWSIQDGAFQSLLPSEVRAGEEAVLLTPSTGLVGVPRREKDGCSAQSLMQPRLKPGGLVRIEAKNLTGDFKVTEVSHKGDFRGGSWHSDIKGKPRA